MPRPSQVQENFWKEYAKSPEDATKFYYDFSQNSNYIRRDRIKKDMKWVVPSEYGDIDITINLSKPEKDPKAIAAAKNSTSVSFLNASFVWKTKVMQVALTTLQEKTTV